MAKTQSLHKESIGLKVVIYIVCVILALLCSGILEAWIVGKAF